MTPSPLKSQNTELQGERFFSNPRNDRRVHFLLYLNITFNCLDCGYFILHCGTTSMKYISVLQNNYFAVEPLLHHNHLLLIV